MPADNLRSRRIFHCKTMGQQRHGGERSLRGNDELVLRHSRQLLAEAREELRRADAKASHGLAACATLAVALFTAIASGAWRPADLTVPQNFMWWIGWVAWVAAAALFVAAVVPRLGVGGQEVSYFGDVERLADDDARLRTAIDDAAREPLPSVLAELRWTSRAALTRYRLTRLGLLAFALSLSMLTQSVL